MRVLADQAAHLGRVLGVLQRDEQILEVAAAIAQPAAEATPAKGAVGQVHFIDNDRTQAAGDARQVDLAALPGTAPKVLGAVAGVEDALAVAPERPGEVADMVVAAVVVKAEPGLHGGLRRRVGRRGGCWRKLPPGR